MIEMTCSMKVEMRFIVTIFNLISKFLATLQLLATITPSFEMNCSLHQLLSYVNYYITKVALHKFQTS